MHSSNSNIDQLWQGLCQGNALSQKEFYKETYGLFMSICMRYAPATEDAEQWVNDGYIKIFNNTAKYNNSGSLEGWLKRLMVNNCLDNLRQLKTQYNSVHLRTKDPDNYQYTFTTANEGLLEMDSKEILNLINELPMTQKTVFNMYAIEGYSHKEIAENLGIKEANSQWHLNRARNFLKDKIVSKKKAFKLDSI
jgi:RNA polymerase sigma factor (sigma-70 family)